MRHLLSALLLILAGAIPPAAQTWNTQLSGTMRQLNDVEFISSTQIVAVGDKFGANFTVIYSTNGGTVWNDATVAANLNAVAFDGAAGIAVGDGGTIVRTADSGVNWVDESGATSKNLAALAVNGNTVIAVGTKDGASFNVVRSTDGGDTWAAPSSLPGGGVNLAAVTFVTSTTVVAVGDKGGGIYTVIRSVDGGDNWAAASSVPAGNKN